MDKILKDALINENKRQNEGLELIASENFVTKEIRSLQGSIVTNKYAEGYPGRRYYGGCEYIDIMESRAIELACKLFNAKYANVQPHSGSSANMIVYYALLDTGDKILSLSLDEGGHLTHGSPVSFSSRYYDIAHYNLGEDEKLDYEAIREVALKERPKLLLAGFSSYPYKTDYKKFREIADEVGAYLLVDMAHIAGLVAGGVHENPVDYAHVVTSTTHKTLRGPRGGLILTNDEDIANKINKATFPALQGGPLEHVIAAKAQCFYEASQSEFRDYAKQVVKNTKAAADEFAKLDAIVSGTDTHLFLLNTKATYGISGKDAEDLLGEVNITLNKNMLPNDKERPSVTSGVRIGFAALTTRGLKEDGAKKVAQIIHNYLSKTVDIKKTKEAVSQLTNELKQVEQL